MNKMEKRSGDSVEAESSDVILFDLPTFPKGVISLSLVNVATCLSRKFSVSIVDLNFVEPSQFVKNMQADKTRLYGIKVSAQNFSYAKEITTLIKAKYSSVKVIWGGELPTLLPEECMKYADCVVSGLFEPVADSLLIDFEAGQLKSHYSGPNNSELNCIPVPRFDLVHNLSAYYSFMGLPLETSRGCTETCSFCMVHVMQKKNYFMRSKADLEAAMIMYKGHFVNIVDYNFGVSKAHILQGSEVLQQSGTKGWMAEMCIEELDDDEILAAMSKSGCRIVYCGLESVEEKALASVHKMNTNYVERYEKIIRKVQSHGIQVAAGIIIGLENMNEQTFHNLYQFFTKLGIIYAKLTFLTYNPGAKVQNYMKKKGEFCTEDITHFDGNHLTYIPTGLNVSSMLKGAEVFIKKFYSFKGIFYRSFQTKMTFLNRLEFILFALCYREAYLEWMNKQILFAPENFSSLLEEPFKKKLQLRMYEQALSLCRQLNNRYKLLQR
jgi:radical SAM superfamily enzyme YgiQ (UPF0313 family)